MDLITGADPIASWTLALVLLIVVTAVVALLLSRVVATAQAIRAEVATVWANGQRVANNTIHIAALHRTREATEAILARALRIAASATALRTHAEGCDGCPRCMLGRG